MQRIVNLEADSVGDNEIIPGQVDKVVRLYRLLLTFSQEVEVTISDGPGNPLSGPMTMGPNTPLVLGESSTPWYTTSAAQPLVLNLSGECAVAGTVWYDHTSL